MAEKERNIKQTNFRLDVESVEAFRTYCKESGLDQADGFNQLLRLLELDQLKTIESTQGRANEIERFEYLTGEIISIYTNSVKMHQETEAKFEQIYREKLESKDSTIIRLQEDLATYKKHLEEADKISTQAIRERDAAEAKLKEAKEKAKYHTKLLEDLEEAEAKLEGYDTLRTELNETKLKLALAEQKYQLLQQQIDSLEKTNEALLALAKQN